MRSGGGVDAVAWGADRVDAQALVAREAAGDLHLRVVGKSLPAWNRLADIHSMMHMRSNLAVVLICVSSAPLLAQNRFADPTPYSAMANDPFLNRTRCV